MPVELEPHPDSRKANKAGTKMKGKDLRIDLGIDFGIKGAPFAGTTATLLLRLAARAADAGA
jgi:hypothetical protein